MNSLDEALKEKSIYDKQPSLRARVSGYESKLEQTWMLHLGSLKNTEVKYVGRVQQAYDFYFEFKLREGELRKSYWRYPIEVKPFMNNFSDEENKQIVSDAARRIWMHQKRIATTLLSSKNSIPVTDFQRQEYLKNGFIGFIVQGQPDSPRWHLVQIDIPRNFMGVFTLSYTPEINSDISVWIFDLLKVKFVDGHFVSEDCDDHFGANWAIDTTGLEVKPSDQEMSIQEKRELKAARRVANAKKSGSYLPKNN